MKYFINIILTLFSISFCNGQSTAMYLNNNCTYKNLKDGETITFNKNGTVKINGKLNNRFKCINNDGVIELYYNNTLINELVFKVFSEDEQCTLKDKRNICYTLIGCDKKRK